MTDKFLLFLSYSGWMYMSDKEMQPNERSVFCLSCPFKIKLWMEEVVKLHMAIHGNCALE